MDQNGIRIITTAEFEGLAARWANVKRTQGRLPLGAVLADLQTLKIQSDTHAWVVRHASENRWTNTSIVPKTCEATFLASE
jgi:hypothetical protein